MGSRRNSITRCAEGTGTTQGASDSHGCASRTSPKSCGTGRRWPSADSAMDPTRRTGARIRHLADPAARPTAPSSKWRNASRTTPRNSGRSAPSTSVYAFFKPVPNRRRCSNVTRRSNAKSSRACGRDIIQQALDLPESEWPVIESGNPQNVRRRRAYPLHESTRVWRERYPERLASA